MDEIAKTNSPIHLEVVQFDFSSQEKASYKIKGNNKTARCQVGFHVNPYPSVFFPPEF